MSRVSVIIPAYNSAEYVGTAIESVLRQSYSDYEIIVVNDGSEDETPEVIEYYSNRAKCIHKQNGGLAAARNTGLDAATGEYVAFLDADDLFLPNKLEEQVAFLDENQDFDIVHSSWYFLTDDKRVIPYTLQKRTPDEALKRMLLGNDVIVHACLVRRECFYRYGQFDTTISMSEDWDTWLRFAANGARIGCIYDPHVIYRIHSTNMHSARAADPTRLKIIERFFENSSLPEDIRLLRPQVLADNYYLWAGAYYRAGKLALAEESLENYFRHRPEKKPDARALALLNLPIAMYGINTHLLDTLDVSQIDERIASVASASARALDLSTEDAATLEGAVLMETAHILHDCGKCHLAVRYANRSLKAKPTLYVGPWAKRVAKSGIRSLLPERKTIMKTTPEQERVLAYVKECEGAAR